MNAAAMESAHAVQAARLQQALQASGWAWQALPDLEAQRGLCWRTHWGEGAQAVAVQGLCALRPAWQSPRLCSMMLLASLDWPEAGRWQFEAAWLAFSRRLALRLAPISLQADAQAGILHLRSDSLLSLDASVDLLAQFGFLGEVAQQVVPAMRRLQAQPDASSAQASALADAAFDELLELQP